MPIPSWLFGLFGLLFALSLIFHQLWWDGFEVRSPHFLVILAALWTALRPMSVGRLLTMIGMGVFAVALDMPDVGSHTLLVLVSTDGPVPRPAAPAPLRRSRRRQDEHRPFQPRHQLGTLDVEQAGVVSPSFLDASWSVTASI